MEDNLTVLLGRKHQSILDQLAMTKMTVRVIVVALLALAILVDKPRDIGFRDYDNPRATSPVEDKNDDVTNAFQSVFLALLSAIVAGIWSVVDSRLRIGQRELEEAIFRGSSQSESFVRIRYSEGDDWITSYLFRTVVRAVRSEAAVWVAVSVILGVFLNAS